MKITMSEQIGTGNFAGDTDEAQGAAAKKFARLVEEKLTEYCNKNYPDAELNFDLSVENVAGCCREFEVSAGNDFSDENSKIEDDIKNEYGFICDKIAEEIYE